ncbi:hypothetical protein RM555_16445 [Micromonospora sp. DSM 115977]|uniref:Uncharacterized protein n=1 Tax=Micromonospora reichwaldensis TaxID=3075516 RepID=A0ABU2WZG2_9ACTN|nr:hypothetical protein [Micromonospora sp. DSM 115977]MDT0530584.1 hypothetical protein [Micromonospora sp. DSM 115977]
MTDNLRADGWRIGFLRPVDGTSPDDLATDLTLETTAPAIVLSVFDSDCAFATAADPAGEAVEFHLNEKIVRALVDDDRFEPLDSQAAAGLLRRAEKAGLVASPDQLASALEERPGPFGDGIVELTEALGIAADQHGVNRCRRPRP